MDRKNITKGLDIVREMAGKTQDQYVEEVMKDIQARHGTYPQIYYEFMRETFSGEDSPTIEQCEENARREFAKTHNKYIMILEGFEANGSIFILDREEKVIHAIYEKTIFGNGNTGSTAFTHYNPLHVDVLEININDKAMFSRIESGRYNISADEQELIDEVWDLIYKQKK